MSVEARDEPTMRGCGSCLLCFPWLNPWATMKAAATDGGKSPMAPSALPLLYVTNVATGEVRTVHMRHCPATVRELAAVVAAEFGLRPGCKVVYRLSSPCVLPQPGGPPRRLCMDTRFSTRRYEFEVEAAAGEEAAPPAFPPLPSRPPDSRGRYKVE